MILADTTHQAWLEEHAAVIADELNVKAVEYSDEPEKYVDHEVLPNFKLLGKKLGKLMPKVKYALNQASGSELLANLRDNGMIDLEVDGQAVQLSPEEVEVRITAKPGYAAANDKGVVVVLATELTAGADRRGPGPGPRAGDPGPPQRNRLRVHGPDSGRGLDGFSINQTSSRAVQGLPGRRDASRRPGAGRDPWRRSRRGHPGG